MTRKQMIEYCIRDMVECGETHISRADEKWAVRFAKDVNREIEKRYGRALAFDWETGAAWIV